MCCKSVAANVFAKTGQVPGEQRGEDKQWFRPVKEALQRKMERVDEREGEKWRMTIDSAESATHPFLMLSSKWSDGSS